MKRIITSVLLTLALCLGTLAFLPGCATANKAAYKASVTTQVTVETAMTGWSDYIKKMDAAGTPVPMTQRAQVKSYYEKYQAAAVLVADAGLGYTKAKGTAGEPTANSALNTAISIAAYSLSDLVALIRAFGVAI